MRPVSILLALALAALTVAPARPATYTVMNLNDGGLGSLRQAIMNANNNAGGDLIDFGPGLWGTITLATALPPLQPGNGNETRIRGGTAFDVGPGPDITIDGGDLGFDGIVINSANECVIEGLRIINCRIGILVRDGDADGAFRNDIGGVAEANGNYLAENAEDGIKLAGNCRETHIHHNRSHSNGGSGLLLTDGPQSSEIGNPNSPNVFSGNGLHGVYFKASADPTGVEVAENSLVANYIGVASGGAAIQANGGDGVRFEALGSARVRDNTIEDSIISGNAGNGIAFVGPATGNTISGCRIGLNAGGATEIPNEGDGVRIEAAASNNTVGDPGGSRNYICGNLGSGVRVTGANTTQNLVVNCWIGVSELVAAHANAGTGVRIGPDCSGNSVRSCVIAANLGNGVLISGPGGSHIVRDNVIGADASTAPALVTGNGDASGEGGIRLDLGTTQNLIAANFVFGHNAVAGQFGVGLFDDGTSQNTIDANFIGVEPTGVPRSNYLGVTLESGADANILTENVISANASHGVPIISDLNTVFRNLIGVDPTGMLVRGNGGSGIFVSGDQNVIGAPAGNGNTISGNFAYGIEARDTTTMTSKNVTVQANMIGVSSGGVGVLGNQRAGIWLGTNFRDSVVGDTFGTVPPGPGANVIANNGYGVAPAEPGVLVGETGTDPSTEPYGDVILTNSIHDSGEYGIGLDFFAPYYGNMNIPSPIITFASATLIEGVTNLAAPWLTPTVQVFSDFDPLCEGRVYLGDATVTGSGTWSLPLAAPPPYAWITATNTAENSGLLGLYHTSEFAPCFEDTGAVAYDNPPGFLYTRLPESGASSSRALAVTVGADAPDGWIFVGGEVMSGPVWSAAVWEKAPDPGTWQLVNLPLPNPNVESRVSGVIYFPNDEDLMASGTAGDEAGVDKPAVWTRDPGGVWTVALLPTPGGAEGSGEVNSFLGEPWPVLFGRSSPTNGPASVSHATKWAQMTQGGPWAFEMLPDYGPELESSAQTGGLANDWFWAAGWGEASEGIYYPLYWWNTGGSWSYVELPLPVGGVAGKVLASGEFSEMLWDLFGEYRTSGGLVRAARWYSTDMGQTWEALDLGALPGDANSRCLGAPPSGASSSVPIVGTSFNAPGDEMATAWFYIAEDLAVHHSLADLVTGSAPDLDLRAGTEAFWDPTLFTMVAGWGTLPGRSTVPHAFVLLEEPEPVAVPGEVSSPVGFTMRAAPNPMRSGTSISFWLPAKTDVQVTVFDVAGRRITRLAEGVMAAGRHALAWDGRDQAGHAVASGIYLVRVRAGEGTLTQQVVLLR